MFIIGGAWIGRTFRLPFPSEKDFAARVQKLVDSTRKILKERGHFPIIRIGYSAIDFVDRPKSGIGSFFARGKTQPSAANCFTIDNSDRGGAKPGGIDSYVIVESGHLTPPKLPYNGSSQLESHHNIETPQMNTRKERVDVMQELKQIRVVKDLRDWLANDVTSGAMSQRIVQKTESMTDEEFAWQLQHSYDNEARDQMKGKVANSDRILRAMTSTQTDDLNRDEAIALQLQSSYDREHAVLSDVERLSGITKKNDDARKRNKNKRCKIDYFMSRSK